MRSLLLVCFALYASLALAQKVDVQFDQATDFSRYHTFAIRSGQLNAKDPELNSDLNKKRIETDISNALTARGLTQKVGRPDLVVRYHFGAARKQQVERYPRGWRGTRVVRTPYQEATLTIDLHDVARQSLVWRAVAREDKGSASDLDKHLDDMVRKSLDKFPPKK